MSTIGNIRRKRSDYFEIKESIARIKHMEREQMRKQPNDIESEMAATVAEAKEKDCGHGTDLDKICETCFPDGSEFPTEQVEFAPNPPKKKKEVDNRSTEGDFSILTDFYEKAPIEFPNPPNLGLVFKKEE